MIAITFALPVESSDLVRCLESKETIRDGKIETIHGRLGKSEITIVHTGVGTQSAGRVIETFLTGIQPDLLISSGFAGSLTEALNAGDLIVAENFSDPTLLAQLMESGALATPRATGSQQLAPSVHQPAVTPVRLVSTDSMLDSTHERAQFAKEHAAEAIDMETEIIAESCAARGVRMLSVRVISDSPNAGLPAPPEVLFDVTSQRTNFGRLIPYVLTHPAAMARLVRFAGQIKRARATLTNVLRGLVINGVLH